jgi:translation initiation factor eIF-2B subunit delta
MSSAAPSNGAVQTDPAPSKPQKQMTKAERRELQEKQRAAKVAKAASETQSGGPAAAKLPHSAAPASQNPRKGSKGAESPLQRRGTVSAGPSGSFTKTTKVATTEEADGRSRGLRIFSHFALQKPVVHVAKGNVHPAIVHLGLMFAEFRICGANARCIATLSVFRRVGSLPPLNRFLVLFMQCRSYKTTQHHRITHCQGTS